MTVFTEINFLKHSPSGFIRIDANEDYNFILTANGRLPRKKDILRSIELLYSQIDNKDNTERLKTHLVQIKVNRCRTKKRRWLKNRKDIFGVSDHTKLVEENYSNLFKK